MQVCSLIMKCLCSCLALYLCSKVRHAIIKTIHVDILMVSITILIDSKVPAIAAMRINPWCCPISNLQYSQPLTMSKNKKWHFQHLPFAVTLCYSIAMNLQSPTSSVWNMIECQRSPQMYWPGLHSLFYNGQTDAVGQQQLHSIFKTLG